MSSRPIKPNRTDVPREQYCKACGANSGEPWETNPSRLTRLEVGSSLYDVPLHAQSEADLTTLCNECAEGIATLRTRYAQLN
jgi:hypothetical protein